MVLYKRVAPTTGGVIGLRTKEINSGHSLKAYSPILVTLSGISMLIKLEQFWKAPSPMRVTEFDITILVKLEQ